MLSPRRIVPAAAILALAALPLPATALSGHHAAGDTQSTTTTTTTTQSTTSRTTATTTTTTSAAVTQAAPPTTSAATTTASTTPSPVSTGQSWSSKPKAGGHDIVLKVASGTSAHAAGDPGVTIANFAFGPSTITIHVGDTVTWTNQDSQPHTATGSGFNTGTLQKGQSGSHTFTSAGTFSYICAIHPFMHGTVVVQASSGGGGGGSGGGSGGSGTPSGTASSAGSTGTTGATGSSATTLTGTTGTTASTVPSLPNTGTNLATTVLVGALLIAAGAVIRRRVRAS